ncbi:hypothetical protein P7C70_g9315, partial [Phenoliferia sp. Uapishka_3]
THARLFLYAQSNARDPQLRGELSKLYRNPRFHFQFTLALYYEILEAQGRLLAAGAQRIREVTIDTADTRARGKQFNLDLSAWNRSRGANLQIIAPPVSGLLDGPRAQAASMGVVNSGVGQMGKSFNIKLSRKKGKADNTRQPTATLDPRLRTTTPQPVSSSKAARPQEPTSPTTPVSVPMSRGTEISIPGPPSTASLPSTGKSLTRGQRRRRGKADRKLDLAAASVDQGSTPNLPLPTTPARTLVYQTPATKALPRAQFAMPPTPPTTPNVARAPYPQSTFIPSPRVNPGSRSNPPNYRYSPLGRPLAGPHKRQHSPPPSSNSKFGSDAHCDTERPRQSPSTRHQHDWRTQMGPRMASSSNGNGNSGGTKYQTSATGPSPLHYPNVPPPFSWDHIVHTRSRAVVYNPTFQPSSASNGASASSSQAPTAPPTSYVPSSKPQKTYADVVFGRSGVSITPSSGTLLPSAPLRTGGNRLDPSKLPSATAFAPAQATQPPMASSTLPPSSSSPTYVATFATIPRTIEANTLQDLQHGVDDCNTYPTLSDISEMPDEDLADDEGEFTEVVSKKTRKSA